MGNSVRGGGRAVHNGGMERRVSNQELESALENYFQRAVRVAGGKAVKLAPVEVGTPDRMVLFPGGVIKLVELKALKGHVSPRQRVWHQRAAELGTKVHVLTGREEVDAFIREYFRYVDKHLPAPVGGKKRGEW